MKGSVAFVGRLSAVLHEKLDCSERRVACGGFKGEDTSGIRKVGVCTVGEEPLNQ